MPTTALDRSLLEAISQHNDGNAVEAETLYRAILSSPPGHAIASYGIGMLCAEQGRLSEAIEAYRDAIALRPDFVDAYINLGTAVLALGRPEEAVVLYRQAITINPENAMARGNLGKALQDLGCVDEAIAAYRAALDREQDNAIVLANLGSALLACQAWEESLAITRRAIAQSPADAMAHANMATALMNLGRREEALAACRQAANLNPRGAVAHASLGGAMLELGAFSEAEVLCRDAIALDPTLPDAHFNLSHALKATNRLEQAALAAREAIALRPDQADYHFHLAHILLLQGDLVPGWAEYDWRWKLPDFKWIVERHGEFRQPRWDGEDIRDKTILIHTEQGLGDIILFARYLPMVVHAARRVIVAAHPSVSRLLRSIEGIVIVSIRDVPLPDFDVHCPLLSLPRAFATRLDSIPADIPYLRPDVEDRARWNQRIGGDRMRVGIVWAGNPATKRDHFRSPGLASVAPLFSLPGIDFVALQVGARDPAPLPPNVLDLGPEVTDLADTAAIMSGLDLMISSCTAPLHLAGALGVPTWAMIPFAPYFPWLLDRTDTPWYPNMRLYRQDKPGHDWSAVVERIAADLAVRARANQGLGATGKSSPTITRGPPWPDVIGVAPDVKTFGFNEHARSGDGEATDKRREQNFPTETISLSKRSHAMSETMSEPFAALSPLARRETPDVLHVGCGVYNRAKLPPVFHAGWREIRLDIDPDVNPDVISSITDMRAISDGAVDAVYSSHNIEHLYPHEVPLALAEMHRVLKPGGFAFVTLPDLQEVARHVAEGKLEEPLYMSPLGPIAALDIIFGHRPALAEGNLFMAHRTGFTGVTLGAALVNAGFAAALVQRDPPGFRLTAIGFRTNPGTEQLQAAQATMLPDPDRSATLYKPAG